MRVRIGCLHFVQKLNGKSRTIQLAKGSPAFNRFYVKKPTQRLTITWGSPCLTCIQKKRIKQKRNEPQPQWIGVFSIHIFKQLNLECTYNFWFAQFSASFSKKKEKGCPAQSPSITMFFPIALQHAIQPTLNQSLGPFQANLFSEKYSPIVLQWLGPPQPSNSFKESWQNLSHKAFVWRFFHETNFWFEPLLDVCCSKTT